MKVLLAVCALALVGLVTTGAASASSDPRVPALQRQVRTLQAQVSSLRSTVNRNADVLNRNTDTDTCRFVYQFRFNVGVIDIFSALIGAAPYNGGFPSDDGACARVGMAPPLRTLASRSPFVTLPALLAAMVR